MHVVLGVDGGNSKTVALVAAKNGRVLGWGRGGCGDIYAKTPDDALHSVETAVQAALKMAGCEASALQSSAFSMAGADWSEDHDLLRAELTQRGYGRNIAVVNDAVGALRAGSPAGWGVAVVCGTGAATSARSRNGKRLWHTSWWQPEGGASGVSRDALKAVYAAEMGAAPPTKLREAALSFFGFDSVERLLHGFTNRAGVRPVRINYLAPKVLDVAAAGDAVARRILRQHGKTLGDYALVAARQVGFEGTSYPLVLAGSVFGHSYKLMNDALIAHVHRQSPAVRVYRSELQPVAGAVIMALEGAGTRCTSLVRKRLRDTMPGAEFFAT